MNVDRMRRYIERAETLRDQRDHQAWWDSLPENHTAKRVNRAMAQIAESLRRTASAT